MSKTRLKLAEIIAEKTFKGGSSKSLNKQVAAYLLESVKVGDLSSIIRDVQARWADMGRVEVIASSAYELDEAAKREIKQAVKAVYPKAKEIIINEERDDQVLSGVKLELANAQLDLTAEAKLKRFRHITAKKGTI
jgi:F0F1-type ATP synthase delta subunit